MNIHATIFDFAEGRHLRKMRKVPTKGSLKREILELVVESGTAGMTDFELTQETHEEMSAVRVARIELVDGLWLVASGYYRPDRYNERSPAWRATTKAMATQL